MSYSRILILAAPELEMMFPLHVIVPEGPDQQKRAETCARIVVIAMLSQSGGMQ